MDTTDESTYRSFVKETLSEIKAQTIKTNGRVSSLERWQSYVIGFCAAITVLMLPVVFIIIKEVASR